MDKIGPIGWALVIFAGLIIVYIVVSIVNKNRVLLSRILTAGMVETQPEVRSKKAPDIRGEITADEFYYLPAASLTLTATALVSVGYSKENLVRSAELVQLSLDAETKIAPDADYLIAVKYLGNIFDNRDFVITTSQEGLLQNVSTTIEDRIGEIVAKVAESPSKVVTAPSFTDGVIRKPVAKPEAVYEPLTYITKTYSRIFKLPPSEVEMETTVHEWEIIVEGTMQDDLKKVNASFRLNRDFKRKKLGLGKKCFPGLYTRRLINEKVEVFLAEKGSEASQNKFESASSASFTCLIPDNATVLKIPLKRSPFVKKVQTPKFSQGLLIENAVSKPSEFEGAISIPINIARAILSIPAAVFQFRITQVKRESDYERAVADLLKAKKERASEDGTPPASTLPRVSPAQIPPVPPVPGDRPSDKQEVPIPKLAKLKGLKKDVLVKGVDFTDRAKPKPSHIKLDPPVIPWNWAGHYLGVWDSYDNDKLCDCVPAACAYQIISWRTNSPLGNKQVVSKEEVITAYSAVSKYEPGNNSTDRGCEIDVFIAHWKVNEFGGQTLQDSLSVKPKDTDLVKLAVYWFGGCLVRLDMPASAYGKQLWDSRSDSENPKDMAGTWGMHCVTVLGYDSDYLIAISCGQPVKMTYPFFQSYNDEVVICLSHEWATNTVKTPTKKALTYDDLASALKNISDNT